MTNPLAIYINTRLALPLFDVNQASALILNRFTKKTITELHMDDLVSLQTKSATIRLIKLVRELRQEFIIGAKQ